LQNGDQEVENNKEAKRKKIITTRSPMVEHVKCNKRKLLQDSNYMYGTPKDVTSKEKGKKRPRRRQRA
jgi:hypothetical protein